jgi:hypothetical protein
MAYSDMKWDVEFTDEFGVWWQTLTEEQQDDVAHTVGLLAELGPALDFPYSSKVNGSRHKSYARTADAERRTAAEDVVCV